MSDHNLYLIHYRPNEVNEAVKREIVSRIGPDLQRSLNSAAHAITQEFAGDSPFAHDFIAELLIKELAGLLSLTEVDPEDCIRPQQLNNPYLQYWFGTPATK